MPKTRFTVDLEIELFNWLMDYAKRQNISRNKAIDKAIKLLKEKEKTDVD